VKVGVFAKGVSVTSTPLTKLPPIFHWHKLRLQKLLQMNLVRVHCTSFRQVKADIANLTSRNDKCVNELRWYVKKWSIKF